MWVCGVGRLSMVKWTCVKSCKVEREGEVADAMLLRVKCCRVDQVVVDMQ